MGILASIIVGAICGWLAGKIMNNKRGLLFIIILGVCGGFVGGWLFGLLNISVAGLFGNILSGVVGSCVIIFLAKIIKK